MHSSFAAADRKEERSDFRLPFGSLVPPKQPSFNVYGFFRSVEFFLTSEDNSPLIPSTYIFCRASLLKGGLSPSMFLNVEMKIDGGGVDEMLLLIPISTAVLNFFL